MFDGNAVSIAVGFKHSCPHQLQAVLISKLKEWITPVIKTFPS